MAAYATLDDVRNLTNQPLTAVDTPSEAAVNGWLNDGKDFIDAALSAFDPPFDDNEQALALVAPLNAQYAAIRVYGTIPSQIFLDMATFMQERLDQRLTEIREGELLLEGAGSSRFIRGAGLYESPTPTVIAP